MFPSFFNSLNAKIYDWKVLYSPLQSATPEIVHLDIDDEAVKAFGQWPWDRWLSAKIVQKLVELGAGLVVFDIFYASAGKTKEGDVAFFEAIKDAGNVVSATRVGRLAASDTEKLKFDEDRLQVDALYDVACPLQIPLQFSPPRVVELKGSVLPLLPIIQLSSRIGHIAGTPDPDGVYRKVALLVRLGDRCIPSLSLAALMAYRNLKPESITLSKSGEVQIEDGRNTVQIPVDARGMMLINWGKPWASFRHYSAKDVLNDARDPSRLTRYKDKIVFVGVTASGNTDFGTTPLSINTPLSRLHSHALSTILTREFIRHVPILPWIAAFSAILAIAFPLVTVRINLKAEAIAAALICLIFFLAVTLCFSFWRYDVGLAEFIIIFLPAACGSLVIRGAGAEWKAVQARRALERYMPPELLERALARGMNPDLSTRRQELTIVFVDMQGFSTLSETVEVEYVSLFLKDFFKGMTRAILQHQGRIHQFLGDGFLAIFGDLVPLENSADAALTAALDMQNEMTILNSTWAGSGIREFESGIRIRIGVNTGMVFLGDLGSDRRLEYTVVGSAVNIASRLQSLAPPGGIMMTSRTRALAQSRHPCEGPESVRLKGFDKEMQVYTIYPASIEAS